MASRLTLSIALLLLLVCGVGHAQSIKGVTDETAFSYLRNGKVAGPASELVEAMLKRAGLNDYQLGIYPWARAYDMAQNEPNVLIYLISRTPDREPLFKWVGEVKRIEYHVYKLRERKDIVASDLNSLKNYSVGVLRDDVRHEYLKAQGFTKLVVSAKNAENFKRLLNRQVQLVPMPEGDAIALCEQAKIDFATLERVYTLDALTSGLYLAYSLETDDDIVARSRAAFNSLKAEGVVARLMKAR